MVRVTANPLPLWLVFNRTTACDGSGDRVPDEAAELSVNDASAMTCSGLVRSASSSKQRKPSARTE